MSALDPAPLIAWAREREAIRVRKERGDPPPWTDDPILAKYRFCNVKREDDRVTVWVREHIREPYAQHANLWFMLAIARWINWPDTLAELIQCAWWPDRLDFSAEILSRALEIRANRGDKVFTGAYTINAPPTKGASKTHYVAHTVLGPLWRTSDRSLIEASFQRGGNFAPTLASTFKLLRGYPAWGDFMTHQVVVDLRWTRYLQNAADVGDWTVPGPGSTRGLNRLSGRKLTAPIVHGQARREMRQIRQAVRDQIGLDLELADIQNCLCETDKYLRVQNGEGAPRALYVPGRGA